MRRLNDDRGAVGVFTAIVIVVLLGMVGLTIDAGALYRERHELRNGADAAALAIAEACAFEEPDCASGPAWSLARSYASANASDGTADVIDVDLDFAARTVTVHTATLTPGGSTLFEPYFASVVGFDGTTVHAQATAEWGHPRRLRATLPLIISECEFPTEGPLPTPPVVLYFHDGNNAEPCNAHAGQDADGDGFLPGGFGWLDTPGGCEVQLTSGTWSFADPGSSPANGCTPAYLASLLSDPVPLPFFDDILGQGSGGEYRIAGFGMFQITGYNFGGQFKVDPPCSGDQRCVSGYFTTGIVYEGDFGGEDHGIVIVRLTG
ncbi:MAG: Tad domain-containing protein [Acidimicrobiia bacterium]|nr:MAG: Tad domain-containing protein [Acidimicrobiia bacterium]